MNRTEKAGWTVLGLTLLAVAIAFVVFMWSGPGAVQRNIRHLMRPEVYEAALPHAVRLLDSIPDGTTILPPDPRGAAFAEAIKPATYSFISKQDDVLMIECGGGFLHYGFNLERDSAGGFRLILQIEQEEDRILITK